MNGPDFLSNIHPDLLSAGRLDEVAPVPEWRAIPGWNDVYYDANARGMGAMFSGLCRFLEIHESDEDMRGSIFYQQARDLVDEFVVLGKWGPVERAKSSIQWYLFNARLAASSLFDADRWDRAYGLRVSPAAKPVGLGVASAALLAACTQQGAEVMVDEEQVGGGEVETGVAATSEPTAEPTVAATTEPPTPVVEASPTPTVNNVEFGGSYGLEDLTIDQKEQGNNFLEMLSEQGIIALGSNWTLSLSNSGIFFIEGQTIDEGYPLSDGTISDTLIIEAPELGAGYYIIRAAEFRNAGVEDVVTLRVSDVDGSLMALDAEGNVVGQRLTFINELGQVQAVLVGFEFDSQGNLIKIQAQDEGLSVEGDKIVMPNGQVMAWDSVKMMFVKDEDVVGEEVEVVEMSAVDELVKLVNITGEIAENSGLDDKQIVIDKEGHERMVEANLEVMREAIRFLVDGKQDKRVLFGEDLERYVKAFIDAGGKEDEEAGMRAVESMMLADAEQNGTMPWFAILWRTGSDRIARYKPPQDEIVLVVRQVPINFKIVWKGNGFDSNNPENFTASDFGLDSFDGCSYLPTSPLTCWNDETGDLEIWTVRADNRDTGRQMHRSLFLTMEVIKAILEEPNIMLPEGTMQTLPENNPSFTVLRIQSK